MKFLNFATDTYFLLQCAAYFCRYHSLYFSFLSVCAVVDFVKSNTKLMPNKKKRNHTHTHTQMLDTQLNIEYEPNECEDVGTYEKKKIRKKKSERKERERKKKENTTVRTHGTIEKYANHH